MPGTTTRLGIQYPLATENVSAYCPVALQAAGVLDNAALILQGTLASRPAAAIFGRYYLATDDSSSGSPLGTMYFDTGSAWASAWNASSRGATNIAASQSTSSASYTTLTTPDQVTGIVLPTNGQIAVWYQATWQESVAGAARAAIFLGANQTVMAGYASTSQTQEVAMGSSPVANTPKPLSSSVGGLITTNPQGGNPYGPDATTGQFVGIANPGNPPFGGGPCYIFAAAGTYTVSVQFKASSGTVTASSRRLWVQAIPFA